MAHEICPERQVDNHYSKRCWIRVGRRAYVSSQTLDPDSSAKLLRSLIDDFSEEHSEELAKLCGGILSFFLPVKTH